VIYTIKKVSDIPILSRDVTFQLSELRDIPAVDGNVANLFYIFFLSEGFFSAAKATDKVSRCKKGKRSRVKVTYLKWCEKCILGEHPGRQEEVGLAQGCLHLIQDREGRLACHPTCNTSATL
jgi:hypothetical protein